ncbi:MAG: TRAP transporter substrate-binding protein [Salinarimonas sp.]|nr:TRAP transporter substrate-binding protein [Salinarimonas sp.]
MTQHFRSVIALALGGVLLATAVNAQTLRVATTPSAPHPWIDAAEKFKEEVEARTDYTVEIFTGGQLGNDPTVVDEMRIGTVDFMFGGVQNVASFVRDFEFFQLNYLWGDFDTFKAATEPDSAVFQHMAQAVEDADVGMKLVALLGGGIRNLSSSHAPVTSPADLEGVRMRVTGSRLDADTWGALGAITTSVPWTEVYTALQTGVVSAFESTISGMYGARHYEVASYHSQTEHQFMMSHMSMATATWERMSEEDRQVILEAATIAGRHGTEVGARNDIELLEALKERGVEVIEVDKTPFIEGTAHLHDENAERLGLTDLLQTVRDMH